MICCALVSQAQPQQYYDWRWKPCDVSLARFVSVTQKTDSGWLRKDFFLATRKLQMIGLYKDSLCKVRHGWFRYYYFNEQREAIGKYSNDKKDGLWVRWYYNGMMRDSSLFREGIPEYIYAWHSNGYMSDSSVYHANGSSVHVYWFDNGSIASAGYASGDKQTGRWKYFHRNGKMAAIEDYDAGKLTARTYYDEEGVQLQDTTNRDREAEFKGGSSAWRSYLENKLQFPPNVKLVNTDVITVVVVATVDEDGKLSDIYIDTPFDPLFNDEAVRVMKKSPKWVPAVSHNRRVKQVIRQPVSFGQYD